jgi:hypothetical protein
MATNDAPCKGKPYVQDHPMIELGRCAHQVGGATYTYLESACPDCGVTARKKAVFACGTRQPAVRPTPENCLSLKWKADRAAEHTR